MTEKLTGKGIVPGVAIGPAFVWRRQEPPAAGTSTVYPESESTRLESALQNTRHQLLETIRRVERQSGHTGAKILRTHLSLLEDPLLMDRVKSLIGQGISAVGSVTQAISGLAAKLETLSTPRLRERATDLRDIGHRLAENLLGTASWESLKAATGILCAPDLTPSEVSCLDPLEVRGIALEGGTESSHTAILARALAIPTVIGVKGLLAILDQGDPVLLDGDTGEVAIRPEEDTVASFRERLQKQQGPALKPNEVKNRPAVTLDGYRVGILANIGSLAEIHSAGASGAEGIGLFRTEFLFLNRDTAPTEDEQFDAYKDVLAAMAPRKVVLRTADMGAEKQAPFLGLQAEPNPSLGLRGIRFSLSREEFFRTQVWAMLRASCFGKLSILLPMVSDISEVRRARMIINELAREMKGKEGKIAGPVPLGVMVETPAAALTADALVRESDFLSIGTNDLTQYVLAADRLNEAVSYLYQPFHPAVLRLLDEVTRAARRNGKPLGVCGELAGDPDAAVLFVGLGVTDLSMSPARIPAVKEAIGRIRKTEATALVQEALDLGDGGEVLERLRRFRATGAAAIVRPDSTD